MKQLKAIGIILGMFVMLPFWLVKEIWKTLAEITDRFDTMK